MSPLLRLDALNWDFWNLEHIAKHDVTVQEILELLDNIVKERKYLSTESGNNAP